MAEIVERLLSAEDPALRYLTHTLVLGEAAELDPVRALQDEVRSSAQVRGLLAERGADGRIPHKAYSKWDGAHWVLAALADLGYPPGDEALIPLREQQLGWLFSEGYEKYFSKRVVAGRVRMHPSIEGNAVYSLVTLGLVDERVERLVVRMADWQWPDGGWNCDMNPETTISSFMESLIPVRALTAYYRLTGDERARRIARGAAEIFLKRGLFKRQSDGAVMDRNFVALHYPCYWHYDVLFGLKVMAEAGSIGDERCGEALDLLESKRLPDGGFPAEAKYYRVAEKAVSGRSLVDWGGTSKKRSNLWVSVDALYVLRMAGRIKPIPCGL